MAPPPTLISAHDHHLLLSSPLFLTALPRLPSSPPSHVTSLPRQLPSLIVLSMTLKCRSRLTSASPRPSLCPPRHWAAHCAGQRQHWRQRQLTNTNQARTELVRKRSLSLGAPRINRCQQAWLACLWRRCRLSSGSIQEHRPRSANQTIPTVPAASRDNKSEELVRKYSVVGHRGCRLSGVACVDSFPRYSVWSRRPPGPVHISCFEL